MSVRPSVTDPEGRTWFTDRPLRVSVLSYDLPGPAFECVIEPGNDSFFDAWGSEYGDISVIGYADEGT